MAANYLFTSEWLGFRNWTDADIPLMAAINADPEVMRYFPSTQDATVTESFILRMQGMYTDRGYCYFPVDLLETQSLIGFIGLCYQDYESPFTPCVDIGWRLSKQAWGRGYATEGALRCLTYGFGTCKLTRIYSTATAANAPSFNVMKKAGMQYGGTFKHPRLELFPKLEVCNWYVKHADHD